MADQTPAPPVVSPDGKFYWDGGRWLPVSSPAGPTSEEHSKLAGGLTLAGAAIAAAGVFMPWLTATAPFVGTISRSGADGDGLLVLGCAVVAGVVGIVILVRHPSAGLTVLLVGLAILSAIVLFVDLGDVKGRIANAPSAVVAQIGPGIFVAGLGVLVWVIGGLVAVSTRARAATPAPPVVASSAGAGQPRTEAGGFYPDPTRRYEERYWTGTQWTARVRRRGREDFDRPPADLPPPTAVTAST